MIGKTISHYRILAKLGAGGMGMVYKAEDLKLKRAVALKFLAPELTRDPYAKARFVHEAEAASALDHPNICTIHEVDETEDGQLFIAMACYEGQTLKERISRGPMPVAEALNIARQIAEGLAKAHQQDIAHRDIKPANIFLTCDGLVKIVDFGLAKLAGQTRMTRTGTTLGTVAYMSPEQGRGENADLRSDVWSLGVCLYEMLTSRLPFQADHEAAVIFAILNNQYEPVTALRPEVPEKVINILDRALAKPLADRYADAGEMATDLETVVAELDLSARPPTPLTKAPKPSAFRHAKIWVPISAVVFAALALLILKPALFDGDAISAPRPVAVISFENRTGDSQYDYLREAIPNLLITSLEQSKYLSVVSWERMRDLLAQSGRDARGLIDQDVGFEVCRLDGIDTIVLGSFARADEVFVTDVKVLDVHSKQLLKSVSVKGEGVGSILANQIDELGREISRGVGLSERSIAAYDRPVAEVTTRSMDAYHFFLEGREEYYNRYPVDARRSLEKAVELDSTFALAWLYLGRAHRNLRDYNSSNRAYVKARELSTSAPEKDRLYIDAMCALVIENDDRKHHELLSELVRRYPKEKLAHFQMALHYRIQGKHEEAMESFQEALALDPEYGEALNGMAYEYARQGDYPKAIQFLERYTAASTGDANPIDSMAEMYFRMGDLDEAISLYKKTLNIRSYTGGEVRIAYLTALKGDYAGAIDWCERFVAAAPSVGFIGSGRMVQSFYYLLACQRDEALDAVQKSRDVFQQMGHMYALSGTWWIEGWVRYQWAEYEASRRCYEQVKSTLEVANSWDSWHQALYILICGLVDLKEGLTQSARKRLAEYKTMLSEIAEFDPDHALMARDNALLFEGEILLAEDRAEDAIAICLNRPEVGIPTMESSDIFFYNFPAERDVLARAYVATGSLDKAIAEYERLVTFNPLSQNRRLVYAMLHYRLGRLYEQNDLNEKATQQYQIFLDFTEGATTKIDEAKDARQRLDAITRAER